MPHPPKRRFIVEATVFAGLLGPRLKRFPIFADSTEEALRIFFHKHGLERSRIEEVYQEPNPTPLFPEDLATTSSTLPRESLFIDLSRQREAFQLLLEESPHITCEEKNLLLKVNHSLSRILAFWQMRTIELETGGKLKC